MKVFPSISAFFVAVTALPAYAGEENAPFFSLYNAEGVVTLGFLLFVGILIYLKVPGMLTRMLDARASAIRDELSEARGLREEAQTILASYERKQKEVAEHSIGIVEHAKAEAAAAAVQAKSDLKEAIARRLQAAEDQIASAEASAIKEVRDTAIAVAISAASDIIARSMTAKDGSTLIDDAIVDVGKRMH